MTAGLFTATEALRRLRALSAEARQRDGSIASWYRVEVGTRTVDQYAADPAGGLERDPDDDLADYVPMRDAARWALVRRHGYVVHLYYSNDNTSELVSVVTGWLGTPELEPVLLTNDNGYRWAP